METDYRSLCRDFDMELFIKDVFNDDYEIRRSNYQATIDSVNRWHERKHNGRFKQTLTTPGRVGITGEF